MDKHKLMFLKEQIEVPPQRSVGPVVPEDSPSHTTRPDDDETSEDESSTRSSLLSAEVAFSSHKHPLPV